MKFYLCDRKKCKNCFPECHHTSDIAHALHPDAPRSAFAFLPVFSGRDENNRICRITGPFVFAEKDGEVEKIAEEIKKIFGPFRGLET